MRLRKAVYWTLLLTVVAVLLAVALLSAGGP